ncbi:MAG: succinoglycan biosynthesis protein exop [Rhizobiaceae bacterium]|nr:succinoglycan biosynthesis protein exop [Rhizobiaceae bacterium]
MLDAESTPVEKPRSLLSMGSGAERRHAPPPSRPEREPADPSALHRLARSRREATRSPLLAALAQEGTEPVPQTETRPAPAVETVAPPPAGDAGQGLFGRLRQRVEGLFAGRADDDRTASGTASEAPRPMATEAMAPRADARRQTEEPAKAPLAAIAPSRPPVAASDSAAPRPFRAAAIPVAALAARPDDQTWRPLIDPMRVITGVLRSKMLIFVCTLLGAMIGVAIALSTPKKYEAVAELLIDPRDLQLVDRNLTEGGLPSDATLAIVENQVRVITSGTVLNRVVDRLDLTNDPEFNGDRHSFGIGTIVAALRSMLSSGEAGGGGDRRRALAVEGLAKSLSVERGGKTFVVVIAAKTESPDKSALIANTVTEVFLETYGKLQSDTAARAAGELGARLDELRANVETAERRVETFKAEHDLIDANGRLISDDEIVKLNDQLAVARARTIELNAKAASARSAGVDAALDDVLPEEISSTTMAELRTQYASLKRDADRVSARLGPRHPERIAVESELAGLRGEIAAELRRIVSSVQVELKRAVQLEQELAARLAQLKVRQGDVSGDLVTLRELEREAAAKRAVYEAYLLRARETGEQKDINTANMSVISTAFPPLDPTGPSRAVISLTGMMLGFMAGIALGGLRGATASLRETLAERRGRRVVGPDLAPPPPAPDAAPEPPAPPAGPPVETASSQPRPEKTPMFSFLTKRSDPKPEVRADLPKTETQSQQPPATDPAMTNPAYPYPQHAAMPAPYPQQPGYPQAAMAQPGYPQHPHYASQPQGYAPPHPYAQQPMAAPMPPQAYAPQQAYPYPHPMQPQPMMWAAPQQPAPMMYPYPVAAPAYAAAPEPRYATVRASEPERVRTEMDEVRESLREFRDAVREITEGRTRRRAAY